MFTPMSRRSFQAALAASVAMAGPALVVADDEFKRDYPEPKFKPSFKKPPLPKLMVQDFVIFGHGDLDMVKTLLEKEPALLNATMDWGAGDFETALGGASHVGNRPIAEFLISKGARIDIFAATMLGLLEVVKGFLTMQPALLNAKGPHGISLITHAKMGKKEAAGVLSYLEEQKGKEGKK